MGQLWIKISKLIGSNNGQINENKLNLSEVIAVGDGANDIPMLNTAGIGIAFCAKPAVKAAVSYHIDKRNLLTVLEFVDKLADKE